MSTAPGVAMGGRQPATDRDEAHREEVAASRVLVGDAVGPTPASRLRAAVALTAAAVLLGVVTALLIGLLIVVAGLVISAAVN
ncbi:MAG: hypothetical protein WHS89_12105 [Acidimicrobiales bacterium]